jgi:lipopolysaccharide assembly outer membrane protein LptD (OstA)
VDVQLTASNIERGAKHPSIIRLKGNVEIKAKGLKLWADEADFDEATGEIKARGNVRVMPSAAVDATATKR